MINGKAYAGGMVATGAAAGIANGTAVWLGALGAAQASGLAGAAATSSALATLGGGAIAAGGGGMAAGITAIIVATAWPAAAVAAAGLAGYGVWRMLR